jgi:hypothetical protein
MAICRSRQRDGQRIRQFVPYSPGAGFERFAGLDGRHELTAACFKEADVGTLIRDSRMREQSQGFNRRRSRISLLEGSQQVFTALLVKVEEQVLLAREVVEDRHPGDIGSLGDLVYLHLIEATLEEETGGDIGDFLPCGEALPRLSIWR